MNKSNQIKDIVKKIQRIVPSVMEFYPYQSKYQTNNGNIFTITHESEIKEEWINLGRPITIQDLLLAIDNLVNSWDFQIYGNGTMSYKKREVKYDLTKSFLENLENDEFREFIYKLICK